jgi:hypothetical protein
MDQYAITSLSAVRDGAQTIAKDYFGCAESTIIHRENNQYVFGGNMIKQLQCAAALMMVAMGSAFATGTKVSSDSKATAPSKRIADKL